MADLEERVAELEKMVHAILAELGGLSLKVGDMDSRIDVNKTQFPTLLNNMAQNSLILQKRLNALENRVFGKSSDG